MTGVQQYCKVYERLLIQLLLNILEIFKKEPLCFTRKIHLSLRMQLATDLGIQFVEGNESYHKMKKCLHFRKVHFSADCQLLKTPINS